MNKIKMTTPLVEMDGDEMTRVLWKMIKDELLCPFVDLNTEYYDLGLEHRNETDDKVTVESARYAGICVHGKIALEQDSPKTRKAVLERISRELSYTERKHPFGTVISYGQLFTALENTEGVKKVLELNLERTGNAARKNDRGDVLLDADALGILEETDLEFC